MGINLLTQVLHLSLTVVVLPNSHYWII